MSCVLAVLPQELTGRIRPWSEPRFRLLVVAVPFQFLTVFQLTRSESDAALGHICSAIVPPSTAIPLQLVQELAYKNGGGGGGEKQKHVTPLLSQPIFCASLPGFGSGECAMKGELSCRKAL